MANDQLVRQDAAAELAIQTVLDSLDSPHSKRAYERHLREFFAWHRESGKHAINKVVVQRYAAQLHGAGMSPATLNQKLSAIRKLALEAAGLRSLDGDIANGIKTVKGITPAALRKGNSLTKQQAQKLLNAPDTSTLKGLRDRAILALLIGCGLRRTEVVSLTFDHMRRRAARWLLIDLVGPRNSTRSVPMPNWTKQAIDAYKSAAGMKDGTVFSPINKSGGMSRERMTEQTIYNIVTEHAHATGLGKITPNDLRLTFAKLAHKGGSALDQIQLSLGHGSIQTTARYLGARQDLTNAPCDHIGLKL